MRQVMRKDVLSRLAATIKSRREARPEDSHTRGLLDEAPLKPAKKLGEEAVEVAIAAIAQDKNALVAETADLLYHLLVVLESRGVSLDEVLDELERGMALTAGGGAVGKSTTARVLQALLARWPSHPRVELVPTDGFLFPNALLEERGLMNRKGFPESYDLTKLLNFLADVKSGRDRVDAPVYSHLIYDVLPDQPLPIERPDIVIVEGLNVLQPAKLPKGGEAIPFVSDFFDFSIYIDAADDLIESWYVERFLRLRQTAFRDPASYFHRYSTLSEEEAVATGLSIWRSINLVNLQENILPTRQRADLILRKGADHAVETVALRKL